MTARALVLGALAPHVFKCDCEHDALFVAAYDAMNAILARLDAASLCGPREYSRGS